MSSQGKEAAESNCGAGRWAANKHVIVDGKEGRQSENSVATV